MQRLSPGDVACWVLKSTRAPHEIVADWWPGTDQYLTRCVRPSYRLGLMSAGQPILLWVSGRRRAGVHALGVVTGPVTAQDGAHGVPVRLSRLADPVSRTELLADPVAREAEVLRMPAGSNPSWLSPPQYEAVLARVRAGDGEAGLGPWTP